MDRELVIELIASSAANFPITSACFRFEVICTELPIMLCTYAGFLVPMRFTFTTNLKVVIDPFSGGEYFRRLVLPLCFALQQRLKFLIIEMCYQRGSRR